MFAYEGIQKSALADVGTAYERHEAAAEVGPARD
jgi:hypothetical protein